MGPLTKAERAALAIVVNSGRAAVEAELLSTLAGDGTFTGHGSRSRVTGEFVGRAGRGGEEPMEALTAETLRARGLVELWPVGIVKMIDHDLHKKAVRPAVLATLTPLAARRLGVKLSSTGGVLRWAEDGGSGEPAEIIDDPATPYPDPLPELERLPHEPRGRRRIAGRVGTAQPIL